MTKPAKLGAESSASHYPHARDDCAECHGHDADVVARWPNHEVRWCHRCTGVALALVVNLGHEVTVGSLDRVDA
ncbi:hypothetical protein [Kribbella catacumbae]|uniref:hypothetical protein n=1 Tax=Kribbella catacumbae TaxID=460086 RepID=UPI00036E303F|nr:hypothetical protein [Kribbella catacumbae]